MTPLIYSGAPTDVGHLGAVTGLTFSLDGTLLASASPDDRTVRVWNTQSWQEVASFTFKLDSWWPNAFFFNEDGTTLTYRDDRSTWFCNLVTGKVSIEEITARDFRQVSPLGRWCAVRFSKDDLLTISIKSLDSKRILKKYAVTEDFHFEKHFMEGFSKDDGWHYMTMPDGVHCLNLENRSSFMLPNRLVRHWDKCSGIGILNGAQVLIDSTKSSIRIWEIASGKCLNRIRHRNQHGWVRCDTKISGCGRFLALDDTLFDLVNQKQIGSFTSSAFIFRSSVFSPDGCKFLIGCDDGRILIISTETGVVTHRLGIQTLEFERVAFDPSGRYVVSLHESGDGYFWDASEKKYLGFGSAAQSSKGQYYAQRQAKRKSYHYYQVTVEGENELQAQDYGRPKFRLEDGQWLAWFPSVRALRIVSNEDEVHEDVKQAHKAMISSTNPCRNAQMRCLSYSGRWLASVYGDNISLMDVQMQKHKTILDPSTAKTQSMVIKSPGYDDPSEIAVSEEGLHVAVSFSGMVSYADFRAKKSTHVMKFGDHICALAMSPDGKTLAAGDAYNRWINIRHIGSKARVPSIDEHCSGMNSIAYSPDGTRIVSCARDGQIILWNTNTFARLATFMIATTRS